MGRLVATFHNKQQESHGYFYFAALRKEMAFFIALLNPIKTFSCFFQIVNSIFQLPINLPIRLISTRKSSIPLYKVKTSQVIIYPLTSVSQFR